jgi:DNA invertase Pin-like site-specific DNA recombinase
MLFGYARISKGDDQSNTLQKKALKEAGVERIVAEYTTGVQ